MRAWTVFVASAVLILVLAGPSAVPAAAQTAVADTLLDVRFGDHGSFERAVLDLGGGDGPSEFVPYYTWRRIQGGTVVRVQLPTVDSTKKTDGKGLGIGISRYYAVRAADRRHIFVDLHLDGSAGSVFVYYLNDPARIVVDVPTGANNPYPAAKFGKKAVVTRPRDGFVVGPGALAVNGYARPFEARGDWRIKNSSGRVVREGSYTTTDWSGTWGSFAFTARYPASLGGQRGRLEVGERSARDGKFEGVSVPLVFR
jgi:hypothetical protein